MLLPPLNAPLAAEMAAVAAVAAVLAVPLKADFSTPLEAVTSTLLRFVDAGNAADDDSLETVATVVDAAAVAVGPTSAVVEDAAAAAVETAVLAPDAGIETPFLGNCGGFDAAPILWMTPHWVAAVAAEEEEGEMEKEEPATG